MKHGSLFSGIGGFDLASEWMGWENVFHCEWNEFGQRVLKYYWPKAISYGDITKTDFTIHRGQIDILTGGFPCQPFSLAGKRKGTEDNRHLWPEMRRVIREIQPRFIVGENVPGILNWSRGLVFEQVCADLEAEGYEVQPVILPAAGVNAPHRRDRVWFVARRITPDSHDPRSINAVRTDGIGTEEDEGRGEQSQPEYWENGNDGIAADTTNSRCKHGQIHNRWGEETTRSGKVSDIISYTGKSGDATNPQPTGLEGKNGKRMDGTIKPAECAVTNSDSGRQSSEEHGQAESRRITEKSLRTDWSDFPTQSPICNGNDGISSRLDSITFPKWRNESIKSGGNAICPQVAYQIFKSLKL